VELKRKRLDNGMWLLSVAGEMDLYNVPEFKSAVNDLLEAGAPGLISDFGELTYIDSSGIGALLYAFSQGKTRNRGICFANVTGSVRTVIELTSLLGFLPIEESVDAAIARLEEAT
tara:strand:+ start:772 stop:1119 length:348 start_codon:yes stop_codon:yes gene_type:complete